MGVAEIYSIGTAVPSGKISQEEHLDFVFATSDLSDHQRQRLAGIYEGSGIRSRYTVEKALFNQKEKESGWGGEWIGNLSTAERLSFYQKHALDLALKAVGDCAKQRPDINIKDTTHIITFSCTGMYAPGLDIQLVENLSLKENTERTCINFMGCYAAFNAMKSAFHIVSSVKDAQVLIVGVEICSIHYRSAAKTGTQVANALFSDGAGAALIRSGEKTEGKGLLIEQFHTEVKTSGQKEMVWTIGDTGFELELGVYVPAIVKSGIENLLGNVLSRWNIMDGETLFAIHPGGRAILEACQKALKIEKEHLAPSYSVLSEYGNMSSVTILFVLKHYLQNLNSLGKDKKIFACAFGPGITIESMLFKTPNT